MGISSSKKQTLPYSDASREEKNHFLQKLHSSIRENYYEAVRDYCDHFMIHLEEISYLETSNLKLTDIPCRVLQNAISLSIPVNYNLIIRQYGNHTTYEVCLEYKCLQPHSLTPIISTAPSIRIAHAALAVAIANNDICPISLELLTDSQSNSVASCGHIVSGVYNEEKCPLCRQKVGWTLLSK